MAQSIVLITGGSNGIGLEACKQFSNQSGIHVIMGSRSVEKGEKAVAEIQKGDLKGSISLVQLDITDDKSIAAAVKHVEEKHGRLDTLLNNAGVCPTEMSREIFRDTFEVNIISPAMTTQAFAPLLRKSKDPRVIYVTSTMGSIGLTLDPKAIGSHILDYPVYGVSKAALNMQIASDTWRYKEDGFKVFAYCPGYVISDLAGIRQKKMDSGAPTPEKSVQGLLAIHQGKEDDKTGAFLHDKSVLEGVAPKPW